MPNLPSGEERMLPLPLAEYTEFTFSLEQFAFHQGKQEIHLPSPEYLSFTLLSHEGTGSSPYLHLI